jgi:membrane-associated phospholipid phosphatase
MVALFFERLRADMADRERRSPFCRETLPIYLLILVQFVLGIALFQALGFRFHSEFRWGPSVPAILIAGGWAARRICKERLADMLEGFGIWSLIGMSGIALAIALTATPVPLADDLLASMDRGMGFEFASAVSAVPEWLKLPLAWSYASFTVQPLILLAVLSFSERRIAGWRLLCGLIIALMLTLAIYPLVPAVAAYAHFGMVPDEAFGGKAAIAYAPAIEAIRAGERLISRDMLVGYVTFPSFHAAAATLFARAAWEVPWLRWSGLILNLLMAVSTIPVGGHYLIDVVGGVGIALLAIWLSSRCIGQSVKNQCR